MATKVKKLGDEEIMRIARISATQGSAGAYIQTALDTQLSIERGVIWTIHWIEFYGAEWDDCAAGAEELQHFQITRESKAALIQANDADLLCSFQSYLKRWATIGTDAGPETMKIEYPHRIEYKIPLPFASQNIYFGWQGSGAAAQTSFARIGYTVRTVSEQFFYRVAQALLA